MSVNFHHLSSENSAKQIRALLNMLHWKTKSIWKFGTFSYIDQLFNSLYERVIKSASSDKIQPQKSYKGRNRVKRGMRNSKKVIKIQNHFIRFLKFLKAFCLSAWNPSGLAPKRSWNQWVRESCFFIVYHIWLKLVFCKIVSFETIGG